ncbi:hypothetical protein F3Y22_tig00111648pilonHSYRG00324 [Hibiscus syriacus]|uniref:Uncharacterized protein n=1 Tax=Hibiscus syriacus TaxID=106335 RepID=A0A6A2YFW2_HIBSY|nr:hypothetical protein F3Y22_tig00111648pilonHSYRG00324 [Hibiscus syriacus]
MLIPQPRYCWFNSICDESSKNDNFDDADPTPIKLKVDADPTPSAMDLSENKNVDPPHSVMESNEMSVLIYLLL